MNIDCNTYFRKKWKKYCDFSYNFPFLGIWENARDYNEKYSLCMAKFWFRRTVRMNKKYFNYSMVNYKKQINKL